MPVCCCDGGESVQLGVKKTRSTNPNQSTNKATIYQVAVVARHGEGAGDRDEAAAGIGQAGLGHGHLEGVGVVAARVARDGVVGEAEEAEGLCRRAWVGIWVGCRFVEVVGSFPF